MSLDELLKNNILNFFHQILELGKKTANDSEVMNQKQLMEFLCCGDSGTLKKYYTSKPDFPTYEFQPNRWTKTQVREWLAKHTVEYKETI
ncbi:hypothetical protein [Fructilactobacillus frigidiflavus]|uniref:hypothetical protein n=1 Tax=Fructilactobacillus frigidiflavus TaxID=3242688 RepID=UPI0037564043